MKFNNLIFFLVTFTIFFIATKQIKAQDQFHPIFTSISINPKYACDKKCTTLHVYSGRIGDDYGYHLNQSYSTIIDGIFSKNSKFGWEIQITSRIGDYVEKIVENDIIGSKHLCNLIGSLKILINDTSSLNIGISAGIVYQQKSNDIHQPP